jgi:hypothetical protein
MKQRFMPGDWVTKVAGAYANTKWVVAGSVRVPSSEPAVYRVVCESTDIKGLLQIFSPEDLEPGHAVKMVVPDGVYDNPITMEREWWQNDRATLAISIKVIKQANSLAASSFLPWGSYPPLPPTALD